MNIQALKKIVKLFTSFESQTSKKAIHITYRNIVNHHHLIIIIIIIIIFVLMSVFYACRGWTVSYARLPSIPVFSYVLADFPFFQITSDYLPLTNFSHNVNFPHQITIFML